MFSSVRSSKIVSSGLTALVAQIDRDREYSARMRQASNRNFVSY